MQCVRATPPRPPRDSSGLVGTWTLIDGDTGNYETETQSSFAHYCYITDSRCQGGSLGAVIHPWDDILSALERVGGLAGIGAFILIIVQAIRTRYEVLTAKSKADFEIKAAKARSDEEIAIAKAQVEKLKAESDVISAKAADLLVSTMQRRLDTLTARIEAAEKEAEVAHKAAEAKDAELVCLKHRVDDLEHAGALKDIELKKRENRITDLEKQVATQASEIERLKSQVTELQKRKTGPLPFLAPKAEG